jgi:carboxymethylenebutenolidase
MAMRDYLVGEVVDYYADGQMSRREALRRLGLFGLTFTTASALLAACGDDDDPAPSSTPTSASPTAGSGTPTPADAGQTITFAGSSGQLTGSYAAPAAPTASLLVIHENRGLTPHFHDLVRRFSAAGYAALCVDLLSPEGGTAAVTDPDVKLGDADDARLVADLRAGIDELLKRNAGRKVGVVGFCFGGGMTWQLLQAGEARLAAAAPFYGPAPENPDFSKAKAAVFAVYGDLDGDRVNGTRERARAALQKAGLTHEVKTFAGAKHAFFNDTGMNYNEAAAKEANTLLLAWFQRHLA